MPYIMHCYRCSSGDWTCEELHPDERCPHCRSAPGSYSVGTQDYCWLHREPMAGEYALLTNIFFTTFAWRGCESAFPNAKLYEALFGETAGTTGPYCCKCQQCYEEWSAAYERGNEIPKAFYPHP